MYRFLDFDDDTNDMNTDNLSLPSTHVHFNPAVKPRSRLGRRRLPTSNDDRQENGETPMQRHVGRVWSRDDSGISTGNDTTPSSRFLPFGGGDRSGKNVRPQADLRQQDRNAITPSSNLLTSNENKPRSGKFAQPSTPYRFLKNEPLKEITDISNNVVDYSDLKISSIPPSTSSSQPSLDMKEAPKILPTLQKQLNTSFCNDESLPVMSISESLSQSNVGNKTGNDTYKSDDTSFMTAHDIQRPDFLTNRTFYDPEFLKTPGRNLAEIRIDESPFNPLEGFPDRSDEFAMDQSKEIKQSCANGDEKSNLSVKVLSHQAEEMRENVPVQEQPFPKDQILAPEIIYSDKAPVLSDFSVSGKKTNRFGRASCSKQLPFDEEPQHATTDMMDTSPLVLVTQKKVEEFRARIGTNGTSQKSFNDTSNVTYPQSSRDIMPSSNGFSSQFSQTPLTRNGGTDNTWSNRTTDTFPLKSLNLNSFAKRPDVTYPSKVTLAKPSSNREKDIFVMSISEDPLEAQSSTVADPSPPKDNVGCPVTSSGHTLNSSALWTSTKSSFTNTPTVVRVNVSSHESASEMADDNSSYTSRDYTVKAAPVKPAQNNVQTDSAPRSSAEGRSQPSQSHVQISRPREHNNVVTNGNDNMNTIIARPARAHVQEQPKMLAPSSLFVSQVPQNSVQPNVVANPSRALDYNNTSIPCVLKPQPQNVIRIKGVPYTVLSLLGKGGSSQVYQALGPQSSKLMAIKCVNLSQAEESMAADYLNEIELLSKLQGCPCVIKMFDSEYVPQTQMLYVVLEKGDIDFSKLVKNISDTKQISMPMIIYYWTEMLNAVQEIHKRDIIHSDLKPANFLLVEGRLKLIDFGIASSIQGDTTSVMKEVPAGTYNYMSPESITGPKITRKSDVWSLGCILFNLLYGRTPFGHLNHPWQKLHAIADPNHIVTFPKLSVHVPPSLRFALRWCLNKKPTARPTVEDLVKLSQLSPDVDGPLGKEIDNMMITYFKRVIPDLKALKEEDDIK